MTSLLIAAAITGMGGCCSKCAIVHTPGQKVKLAAVGVMGKLRDIFERAFDASTTGNPAGDVSYFTQGLMYSGTDTIDPMGYALNAALGSGEANWSMKKYKATVAQEKAEDEAAREEWDELWCDLLLEEDLCRGELL